MKKSSRVIKITLLAIILPLFIMTAVLTVYGIITFQPPYGSLFEQFGIWYMRVYCSLAAICEVVICGQIIAKIIKLLKAA